MPTINSSQIEEFGISDENDVIALGFKLASVFEFQQITLSVERGTSAIRQNRWGPYVELNGCGDYDALIGVSLSSEFDRLSVYLAQDKIAGDSVLSIELPELSVEQLRLVQELCSEIEAAMAMKSAT